MMLAPRNRGQGAKAALACLLLSCSSGSPGSGETTTDQVSSLLAVKGALEGPLATLPAAVKQNEFRLTPPRVNRVLATRANDGTTNVTVVFDADPRLRSLSELVLPLDQGPIALKPGTDVAGLVVPQGGRAFVGNVRVAFADVAATQRRAGVAAAELGERSRPVFRGRELQGQAMRPGIGDGPIVVVGGPIGAIDAERSLLVTHSSVLADPLRTYDACTLEGTPLGAWTFGKLMTDMAGSMPVGDFVEAWFNTYLAGQVINGFAVAAQPSLAFPSHLLSSVLAAWPKLADGSLNVAQAPFKLRAIVNRADLAGNTSYGPVSGAEGRFVFQLVDVTKNGCPSLPLHVILEFGVPKNTCSALASWAQQWLALSTIAIGTPEYLSALQGLTDQFATANADPSKPNGSALNQLRSNAFVGFGFGVEKWELREFHLQPNAAGDVLITPATVAQTPDASYDGQRGFLGLGGPGPLAAQLGEWIGDNVVGTPDPLAAPAYTVPLPLPCPLGAGLLPCAGLSLRGGAIFNNREFWTAPGPTNSQLNVFSLNTCDGCHGRETNVNFIQLGSGFMTGETVVDPRDPSIHHTYNDLLRRKVALEELASAFCGKVTRPPERLQKLVFPRPIPPLDFFPILATH